MPFLTPRPTRLVGLACLALTIVHCGGTRATEPEDTETDSVSEALDGLPPRCFGKMLKPTPLETEQPIGLPMTVRVNRACDVGAPLVARKLRLYVRRVDGGSPGPQRLLMDWTDWPAGQFRFEFPWTAGLLADTSALGPGRYRLYSYSLNASLYDAWVANDAYARQMSRLSDNTYVELVEPGAWASTAWGPCSAACGGGTQTRSSACEDASHAPLASRMCLTSEPASSQACGTAPCTYAWSATSFSSCSAPCGGGTQSRTVSCVRQEDSVTVADDLCEAGTRPVASQSCNTSACPTNSCVGHCGGAPDSFECFCDAVCTMAGDCCSDYAAVCS